MIRSFPAVLSFALHLVRHYRVVPTPVNGSTIHTGAVIIPLRVGAG